MRAVLIFWMLLLSACGGSVPGSPPAPLEPATVDARSEPDPTPDDDPPPARLEPATVDARSEPDPTPHDNPAPNALGPAAEAVPSPRVKLGIDVLLDRRIDLVAGKKVGLVTNASAVDGALRTTVDRLIDDPRVDVVQLYSPEHGLAGAMANGRSDQGAPYTRNGKSIPVQGLTGDSFRPTPQNMSRHDVLVFDIQDIGSRTYTYISSLGLAMEAARRDRMTLIVLDRPNPLGGLRFEGPVRIRKYKSFVGWGPLPVTHGMTVGEVARFYHRELGIDCTLDVVQMEGWRRDMLWQDTGLTWVPTSPGIPHARNAQLYVATGMVGGSGANVNEGGGNSMPFELIGALFIDDPRVLAERLNDAGVDGVFFRPLTYRPWRRQFKGKQVGGVQLMLLDPVRLRPLRAALTILVTLQALYGAQMTVDARRFGRIWGNDWVLPMIRAGRSVEEIEAKWAGELEAFAARRAAALLYPVPDAAAH